MSTPLSTEWVQARAAAAAAVEVAEPPAPVVRYEVDDVAWWLQPGVGGGPADDASPPPDVTITFADEATAVGVSTGSLSIEVAVLDGRIRVAGDVHRLLGHTDEFAAVAADERSEEQG